MDTQLPPSMVIYQLANAHYLSQALYVAAHLGIADLLAEGPQTPEALAAKTGTHAGSLRRVLRLLASAGVFAEDADGRFELTPVGSALCSGPGSSRAAARLIAGPMVWQCWGDLLTTVRTGEPAFPRIFKTDSFEYFAHHPEEAAVFDEAMSSFTAVISGMVAAAYDFSGMHQVIDVGGGDGRLLTGILRAYPSLQGTVFDLPRLGESARRQITGAGLADRYRFVAGDFFEAVPEGFDAYLLKHVIHDWDDARAVRLLENCRRAMSPQAKLLIIEAVYPPHIDDSAASRWAAANDVNMLVCTGGRQRAEAEFRELYATAGFRLTRIIPTQAAWCVIEGAKA
jgi:ubiquinone/menaquinone biosynthesis C-methylase UbiE